MYPYMILLYQTVHVYSKWNKIITYSDKYIGFIIEGCGTFKPSLL